MVAVEKSILPGLVTIDGEPFVIDRDPETNKPLFTTSLETEKQAAQQPFRETVSFGPDGFGDSLGITDTGYHDAEFMDPETQGVLQADLLYQPMGLQLPQPVTQLLAALPTQFPGEVAAAPTGSTGAAGDAAWTNPTNITAEDGSVASVTLDSGEVSGELLATAFGISTIWTPRGITVAVKTRRTGAASAGATMSVRLRDASGNAVGPTRTKAIPDALDYVLFGGDIDDWSGTFDGTGVSDADFGAIITAAFPDAATAGSGTQERTVSGSVAAVAGGNPDWSSAANAAQVDSTYATTASVSPGNISDPIDLETWAFSLPAGAVPTGVRVDVTGKGASGTTPIPFQVYGQLLTGGNPEGGTLSLGTINNATTQTVGNGGAFSLWSGGAVTEGGANAAAITSPAPGSVLPGSTVTFQWTAAPGATEYTLWVGSTPSGAQYYMQSTATNRTATVTGLPTDGSTVYTTLWYKLSGTWFSVSSTFIAFGGTASLPSVTKAEAEASGFGVRLVVKNVGSAAGVFSLDGAKITVEYTGGTAGTGTVEVDHVTITLHTEVEHMSVYGVSRNQLVKVNAGTGYGLPLVEHQDTHAFTDPTSGVAIDISDMIVLKDGESPGNAMALVGFRGEKQLEQIDDIAAFGADTYHTSGAASGDEAYAGVFGMANGAEAAERRVWKSTAVSGQADGRFARLQNAVISTTDLDYTDLNTWEPPTPYQVGDFASDINAIEEFQNGIAVGKPEGVYQFNSIGHSYFAYGMRSTRSFENANTMRAWETGLLIATARDLAELPAQNGATVGISRLPSNLSRVQGFPTAIRSHNDDLYLAYYDGTDSYLLRAKRRQNARVPQPLVFYPIRRIANYRVSDILVFTDPTGATWLCHPGPDEDDSDLHDIWYTILAPARKVSYAASGYLETSLQGTAETQAKLERLVLYARNVGPNLARWRLSVAFDEGEYGVIGDWVQTPGRFELRPDGITDQGYLRRYKVEYENDVPSNRPQLLGLVADGNQPGGLVEEGQLLEEPSLRFEFFTTIQEGQRYPTGGDIGGDVATRVNFLLARARTYVDLDWDEYPFAEAATEMFIEAVTVAADTKDIPNTRGLRLRVKGRAKVGVGGWSVPTTQTSEEV